MDFQPNFYAQIPAYVRYDGDLKPNAKLLYGEITALTNMKGYCWANNEYFSKLYKVDPATVSRWISQLAKKGYVTVELIYKGNSKIVKERKIRLSEGHFMDDEKVIQKDKMDDKKVIQMDDKKVKDNNTVNNTLNINNTSDKSEEVDKVIEVYKKLSNLPEVVKFTTQRKKAIKARINSDGLETVIAVLEMLDKDSYYSEENRKGTTWYTFKYIFDNEKFTMLVERNNKLKKSTYNNYNTNQSQQTVQYNEPDTDTLYSGGDWE